jgi:hypothetical protein
VPSPTRNAARVLAAFLISAAQWRSGAAPAAAFLTGLGAAVGPASRLRRRYADAPAAASCASTLRAAEPLIVVAILNPTIEARVHYSPPASLKVVTCQFTRDKSPRQHERKHI